MYYEQLDIINSFKKVKGQRPVKKLPKLTSENLTQIKNLTDNFNTKWSNIDPSIYFKCGLKLWKTFSYSRFMNSAILEKYIHKDKIIKRKIIEKNDIIESFQYIKHKKHDSLYSYTKCKDGTLLHLCCLDFFYNKIDKVLISYLMFYNYFKVSELDKRYTNYIWNNKKEMKAKVKRWKRVIQKCENEILKG